MEAPDPTPGPPPEAIPHVQPRGLIAYRLDAAPRPDDTAPYLVYVLLADTSPFYVGHSSQIAQRMIQHGQRARYLWTHYSGTSTKPYGPLLDRALLEAMRAHNRLAYVVVASAASVTEAKWREDLWIADLRHHGCVLANTCRSGPPRASKEAVLALLLLLNPQERHWVLTYLQRVHTPEREVVP